MPEFEEENVNASQSESYTPSTDASKKPRTRRRSGGFKTEVASISNAKMGEVSAAEALKEEKLSGSPSASEPRREREDKPRRERAPREPRGERAPREPRGEREPREPRGERAPREPRRETNPQPSAETLAAISSVEAKIAERRTERDKNRPAKSERTPKNNQRDDRKKPAAKQKQSQGGLLAAITGFFGKLFGSKPTPKKGGPRGGQGRGRRPQGKGGNRGGQNRQGGRGGNRGGQGPRRNDRRRNENAES